MAKKMKVFVSEGRSQGRIVTMPVPTVAPGTVLVKVAYCGICGTDQDLFSGECSFAENGQVTYPVRLGHEWSGVVEAIGEGVADFAPGDRVVGDNAVSCGKCEFCLADDYAHCEHMLNVGTIDPVYDGAFCEYYLIPAHHLHKIPEGISLKEASLAEPLSVAYGGIKHMNITKNSTVAIIGTGCIGMAAVVLAKCLGAKTVWMIGRNESKLAAARALGAEIINIKERDAVRAVMDATEGRGADFVLECSGARETFKQAIDLAAFRATVALIGFYEHCESGVNVDTIVAKALTLIGVMGEVGNMAGALRILAENRPNLLPILTDELAFDDCIAGFTRKKYPDAVKIAVKIGEVD